MSENMNIDTATLRQLFKEAIKKVGDNPTAANKKALSKLFKTHYNDNKVMFYEMFQLKVDDGGLSLSEQEVLFDSLEAKQKCALYNLISLQAREDYRKYIELIPDAEGTKLDKFLTTIRGQAVADALVIEQNLLDGGMCTRDWSIEQIKNIYKFGKKGGLCQEYGYC